MEGSDYKDKCSQWADDMRGMSNCEKGKWARLREAGTRVQRRSSLRENVVS